MSSSSIPTQIIIGGFGPIMDRTPTPFPFLAGPNNSADNNRDPAAALTPAEANREILCGAIQALCRCELPRPFNIHRLLNRPVRTQAHGVPPTNSSIIEETILEEETPLLGGRSGVASSPLAAPTPTSHNLFPVIPTALPPPEFNTGMFPHRVFIPVLDRLARQNTVFLVDDSYHMNDIWLILRMCLARCASAIIKTMGDLHPSPDDLPYSEDGDTSVGGDDIEEAFPSISLYFLNSKIKVRDIAYPDTILRVFDSVAPRFGRAPLGGRLYDIILDMFPGPSLSRTPAIPPLPLNIIVPTAGHITDHPAAEIESFQTAMEVSGVDNHQVAITLYQVGSDSGAANLLDSYDRVYNLWGSGSERDIVYTELCEEAFPGGQGDGTISVRKLFRAVTRGMRERGSF